jgi:hypothetical protein
MAPPARPVEERFWAKVDKAGPLAVPLAEPCWLWMASTRYGYGQFAIGDGRIPAAYRVAYEWANGPTPPGSHLDHLCRNRLCVNPSHLQPVSCGENILRGVGPSAKNLRKTHCVRGHEFTPENTRILRRFSRKGRVSRVCKRCDSLRSVKWAKTHRAQVNAAVLARKATRPAHAPALAAVE